MNAVEMVGFMDDPKEYLDFCKWQIACIMSEIEHHKKLAFLTEEEKKKFENNLKTYGEIYNELEALEEKIGEDQG